MKWTKTAFAANKEENRWQVMNKQLMQMEVDEGVEASIIDRKSTRLNSSHRCISYAVFCLKKKSAWSCVPS